MPCQISCVSKLCATCNFWMGPRTPDKLGRTVVVENPGLKGKCWCLNGPMARTDRLAGSAPCSQYKKWMLLKN